tara:strand:- start:104 stop:448 length:345 start_codon:yes stop_codon:yes gene_type:complete
MIKHIEDYLITLHPGTWFKWTDSKNKIYSNLKLSDKVSVAGEVVDNPFSLPTEQECIDGVAQLQADYDAKDYSRKRAEEYPNTIECIHALLDGGDTLTDLQAQRTAIKNKYPKG